MAVTATITPTVGSTVSYDTRFTFRINLSGETVYSDLFTDRADEPFVYIYAYDSNNTRIGPVYKYYSDMTVSSGAVATSINLSSLFPNQTDIVKVYMQSIMIPYDYDADDESYATYYPAQDSIYYNVVSYTKCEPPGTLSLSVTSAAPGTAVTLSWSDAKAGNNLSITGYEIHRASSTDNTYARLRTISSTSTKGSATVYPPTVNGASYYYKVLTVASDTNYNSDLTTNYVTLTADYSSATAPTVVELASTSASPDGFVELSWSGATAGQNNTIKGYEVWRSTSPTDGYEYDHYIETAETSGTTTVQAPSDSGVAYYFKVLTVGTVSDSDSPLSEVYAALTCTYSSPLAPAQVTVNNESYAYVPPDTYVTLRWSDASDGVNNAVIGYIVYQNSEEYITDLDETINEVEVPSPLTEGTYYAYSVVALGEYSNSSESKSCAVYAYTDPKAPTDITVSESEVSTGSRVVLSWSGAEAGGYNDITGYRVYQSETVNGVYALAANVTSTETSASCYVDAPGQVGGVYYFRVSTVGSHNEGELSEVYAEVRASQDAGSGDSDITVVITPKKHKKRGIIFDDYDTAVHGWTLTNWTFEEPEVQTYYVEVPGRAAGHIDMSTSLTNGDPRYNSRTLSATFELSEGTRLDRIAELSTMVNKLHGQRRDIVLPDDPDRYVTGRMSVTTQYSDMAHACVVVEAVCEPWRYSKTQTSLELLATEESQSVVLYNAGRRICLPEIVVVGSDADVTLKCNGVTWTLTEGTFTLLDLRLARGNTVVTFSGRGLLKINYREASL